MCTKHVYKLRVCCSIIGLLTDTVWFATDLQPKGSKVCFGRKTFETYQLLFVDNTVQVVDTSEKLHELESLRVCERRNQRKCERE